MVFLDQHGVVFFYAMVVAAAAAYRVFLRAAQAGQGLARVEHMDASAGDSLDITVRAGRGAGESLQNLSAVRSPVSRPRGGPRGGRGAGAGGAGAPARAGH